MARKMHPDESRPDDGRDDLSVLHPEREVEIAGRQLVVREYSFIESLQLRPQTDCIVNALYAAFKMRDKLSGDDVLDALAPHADAVAALAARAADVDEGWVRQLSPIDGENLALTWWTVNRDLFVMRATRRLRLDQVKATDGQTSTPASSHTDTADQSASGDTPAGS